MTKTLHRAVHKTLNQTLKPLEIAKCVLVYDDELPPGWTPRLSAILSTLGYLFPRATHFMIHPSVLRYAKMYGDVYFVSVTLLYDTKRRLAQ